MKHKLNCFFLAIVSSPKQHAILISTIKSCLNHIEYIIETHSPKAISRQTTGDSKGPPPPLPPKPSRIQKPLVPPKPARVARPSSTITANKKEQLGINGNRFHNAIGINRMFLMYFD